ncbi:MAG: hypothetical protein GXP16_19815 [Gammaproteobacteria bacterium]|nr:hypothetical protein [Gammaproteobacteria bacterium]
MLTETGTENSREPLVKSHDLSVSHGVCGETHCAGNVGRLGKQSNEAHRARVKRPSGGTGSHADGVAAFDKVTYIACKLRLASQRASSSELLRLNQWRPREPPFLLRTGILLR